MAAIEISDLVFPAFNKSELMHIPKEYGIELFYEFGGNAYWDGIIQRLQCQDRSLSLHGPCVTVNLADAEDREYLHRYEEAFAYGKKVGASFIVVHTNEHWSGNAEALRPMVIQRLHEIEGIAEKTAGPAMVIENVGLKEYNLFNEQQYIDLFAQFPHAASLIDVGHAHVNGWNIPRVVQVLNSRIHAFHLHDNDGQGDQHLPIFSGTIHWQDLMAAVRQYSPQATLVLEYANGDFARAEQLMIHVQQLRRALQF